MQFSELTRDAGRHLYLGILLLYGHCVIVVNLEMYKAIIIYEIFAVFFIGKPMKCEEIEIGQNWHQITFQYPYMWNFNTFSAYNGI